MRRSVLVSLCLVVLFAAVPIQAQPQEEHQTDYPSECLADWDPFCPARPPEYGYAYSVGCFECDYIPQGPNGEPSFYVCSNTGGAGDPSRCTNYDWGCETGGLCQLV